MTTSDVFASRPFLRYWRAGAVSGLGTYVTLFALQALVVLTLHGSAADVGWLNAARWLPSLVFGLVVGSGTYVLRHRRCRGAVSSRCCTVTEVMHQYRRHALRARHRSP